MSLISALASAVYAWLPPQVRSPAPRRSEGRREFDALMAELIQNEQRAGDSFVALSDGVACVPPLGPERARLRRARHG
jgi:hypothetical protein